MKTVLLLIGSNVFMTTAWYGHLKWMRGLPLLTVIAASWLIALPEYALQVPANRIGHTSGLSAPTLKIIQEVISITVFVAFSMSVLGEWPRWNEWAAFGLILAAVALMYYPHVASGGS